MSVRTQLALIVLALLLRSPAQAQIYFTVDPKYSLAWWQVDPHLQHLWATTCPEEPSWRPGEGRSGGWTIGAGLRNPDQGYAAISDSGIVPLYPRYEALPLCTEAVSGEVVVDDTSEWRGIRGRIAIRTSALVTGEDRRDKYAREAVLEAKHYPEITYTIDSVVGVTTVADTLSGTAYGTLSLHGVTRYLSGPVEAWPEEGGLRVLGRVKTPAEDLVQLFNLSRWALGLGVVTRIWRTVFMGVDVVVFPAGAE